MCLSPGSGPSGRSPTWGNNWHGISVFRVEYLVLGLLLWQLLASTLSFLFGVSVGGLRHTIFYFVLKVTVLDQFGWV